MATKTIFKGRIVSLKTKKVRLPNGYVSNLEIVEHPGAVLVIPFLTKNKLIFLRQFRPVLGAYLYELPAGTLKPAEAAAICAKREVIEETGYKAATIKKLGFIYPVPGYSTEKITIFMAQGLIRASVALDEDEIIESFVLTKKQVKDFFKTDKIVDAKTICALAKIGWI